MATHVENKGDPTSLAENAFDTNSTKEDESNPLSDRPQPSKTLALEPPHPQQSSPLNQRSNLVEVQFNDQDQDDSEVCVVCSPRGSDTPMSVSGAINSSYVSRRCWKGKKQALKRRAAQEKSQKKLEILAGSFKPIPFVPVKSIDFSTHENLLRRLGLWDFVHIEFDRSIGEDLLLQLVATFSHTQRCSYVNGCKIKVNRADLARALRLTVKKPPTAEAPEEKTLVSEESIAFMDEFVSNWLLLHEDTWMMPSEILNWTKVIKDGHFERVDWAGLIWFMVEKELMQAPHLVNCYYASHLQYLIKSQREEFLRVIEANTENVEVKGHQDVHEDVKMGAEVSVVWSPSGSDTPMSVSGAINSSYVSWRGWKGKKQALKRRAALEKSQKKLELLADFFKPIPFVPVKSIDFSTHENLLRQLGLWDFVHIKFDRSIREDLLLQLVATFSHTQRCSYVNGCRIKVNRADLAHALRLKVKKPATAEAPEEKTLVSEESIAFMDEFVSNWLLLHEDTWMMPSEILNWTKLIKDGHFERVDWAGLIWFMVEKELMQAPHLVNCYYASHMQYLIRSQREEFLRVIEANTENVEVKDHPELEEEDEEDVHEDAKMGADNEFQECRLEEHSIELSLGQENFEKAEVEKERVESEGLGDFMETKYEETEKLLLNAASSMPEPFMRRCDFSPEINGLQEEKNEGEAVEEEEQVKGEDGEEQGSFRLSPKCDTIAGFSSGNFIQAMDVEQIPFTSGLELRDHSPVEFLSLRDDNRMNSSGPLLSGNSNKRVIAHDNEDPHPSMTGGEKRLRMDGSSDFEMCMEQVQQWMGKPRMMYAEKEQIYQEANVHQQYLIQELQQRENYIEHLRKSKFEEQQKKEAEIYRLERELYMMGNLLRGYRKALDETHKTFAEYRARNPQPDEPLYKDVPGSGGLVLSTMEFEKMRLKQEEEDRMNRLIIEKKVRELEEGFVGVLDGHLQKVSLLNCRIIEVENEAKLLKKSYGERSRGLESLECPPNES